jgi:succinate dehydrogenase/fumarate reductase flavoprotein subunit
MKTTYHTLIIGSGCAGYHAAERLHRLGVTDIAILTEGRTMGTSRNTGSDKQTYYKLSLCGDDGDSVREMAQTLFAGGAVNGCAYAPFILTVDWLGWVCYLPDKLEFILSYHVLPS